MNPADAEVTSDPSTDDDVRRRRRATLVRRVRILVACTIAYNVAEAGVALAAGFAASSAALVGFGLDSVIEVSSATAIAWQFSARDDRRREERERVALRVVAASFFGLAAFVTVDSVSALALGREPEHSTVGLGLASLSLVIMPVLSWVQRRAGRELRSAAAVSDSKQTLLCTYLSGVLLVGLLLNSLWGIGWADAVAALVIAAVAVKEGLASWRGDSCCAPPAAALVVADAGSAMEPEIESACGGGDGCCGPSVNSVAPPRSRSARL